MYTVLHRVVLDCTVGIETTRRDQSGIEGIGRVRKQPAGRRQPSHAPGVAAEHSHRGALRNLATTGPRGPQQPPLACTMLSNFDFFR